MIEVFHHEQKCDHWNGRERRAPQEQVKQRLRSKQSQVFESRVSEGQKGAEGVINDNRAYLKPEEERLGWALRTLKMYFLPFLERATGFTTPFPYGW